TAVNDAPTTSNNAVTTKEHTAYAYATTDFPFTDVDGDAISSITITQLATAGTLKLNGVNVTLNQVISAANIASGLLKFVPAADANGTPYGNFKFTVSDGTLSSGASTMTVNVTAVNDAPTTSNNAVTT